MDITESILINKNKETVWGILGDINNWGRWSPAIDHAVSYGALREGSKFKCISGKWEFDCRILFLESEKEISFYGRAIGLIVNMTWKFESENGKTRVMTSANTSGWMTILFRKRIDNHFGYELHRWLMSLKNRAERGASIVEMPENEDEMPERQGKIFTTPFSFLSDLKKSKERRKRG